jgi:P27 family predicted phage terminase small subunit
VTAEPVRIRPVAPSRTPKPPAHLGPDGRRLWRNVLREYRMDEGHSLELLRLACEAIDRAEQARVVIAAEGMTIEGRFGAKTHPAVQIERDSAIRASRLLRELGLLDVPEARPPSRWRS